MKKLDRLTQAPLLCDLLDRPVPVVVATVGPEGSPQASVVWVERRDDDLAMFFMVRSAKVRNLVGNPQLAVVAVDHAHLHAPGVPAYALLTGPVELGPGEPAMPDRLARSYGSSRGYLWELGEFTTAIMKVDRVTGLGPVNGGAMGGWRRPSDRG